MSRVKGAVNALKRRRSTLAATKGYRHGRRTKERSAKVAIAHAGNYAFAHRRDKKSDFRALWMVRLNAALRPLGFSYSKFAGALKKNGIELNRKVLSEIAAQEPKAFERIVSQVK